VATTGDKFTAGESEQRRVVSKSDDSRTLTLDQPLALSITRVVGSGADTLAYSARAPSSVHCRSLSTSPRTTMNSRLLSQYLKIKEQYSTIQNQYNKLDADLIKKESKC